MHLETQAHKANRENQDHKAFRANQDHKAPRANQVFRDQQGLRAQQALRAKPVLPELKENQVFKDLLANKALPELKDHRANLVREAVVVPIPVISLLMILQYQVMMTTQSLWKSKIVIVLSEQNYSYIHLMVKQH